MFRYEFIQQIINKYKYNSYLEIGCSDNSTFNRINIRQKTGVDPNVGGTHRMTSDQFFLSNKEKFDIIFIDGLHISDQVDRDIQNSLNCLNENGTIVLHDCNPVVEEAQRQYVVISDWNGDVWKSLVKQRQLDNVDVAVANFDHGCGVLRVRKNSDKISVSEELNWNNLVINRQKWLRLMPFNDIMNWMDFKPKEEKIEENFNVSILVPVLNRPQNVDAFISSYLKNSPIDKTELIFITNEDCKEEIEEIKKYSGPISIHIVSKDIMSWAKRINYGINNSTFSHVLCAADDIIFHPNWFQEAEKHKDFIGIIGTNDLGNPGTIQGYHSTHPIVNRKYVSIYGTIDEKNKLCNEGYIHNYVDVEMISTAKKRNCYKHCFSCILEHLHPAWKKAQWDEIYQIGQNNWNHDQQLWLERKAKFNLV